MIVLILMIECKAFAPQFIACTHENRYNDVNGSLLYTSIRHFVLAGREEKVVWLPFLARPNVLYLFKK